MLRRFLVFLVLISPPVLAEGLADLGLVKRQLDTAINAPSVTLVQEVTSISAEGDMDAYGKVYVIYHLSYDAARRSGTVDGQGRGFTSDGYAFGRFQDFWEILDGVVTMRNVLNINNWQMNFDGINFDPVTRDLVVQVYILKQGFV